MQPQPAMEHAVPGKLGGWFGGGGGGGQQQIEGGVINPRMVPTYAPAWQGKGQHGGGEQYQQQQQQYQSQPQPQPQYQPQQEQGYQQQLQYKQPQYQQQVASAPPQGYAPPQGAQQGYTPPQWFSQRAQQGGVEEETPPLHNPSLPAIRQGPARRLLGSTDVVEVGIHHQTCAVSTTAGLDSSIMDGQHVAIEAKSNPIESDLVHQPRPRGEIGQ